MYVYLLYFSILAVFSIRNYGKSEDVSESIGSNSGIHLTKYKNL